MELVWTPFVNNLEMDAVAVLVPAQGTGVWGRAIRVGGRNRDNGDGGGGNVTSVVDSDGVAASDCCWDGGGCTSRIFRRLLIVCLATTPSEEDDESSSVPSVGGVICPTALTKGDSFPCLQGAGDREDLDDDGDCLSADIDRRVVIGEGRGREEDCDRDNRCGEVCDKRLELLPVSEVMLDRNEETRLDGADAGAETTPDLELLVTGIARVRFDVERLRLVALLRAARLDNMV